MNAAAPNASGPDAALYDAGYGSPSRVYERADRLLGMSPGAYRNGAPGAVIRCGYARTALGWLAVAATARGVATNPIALAIPCHRVIAADGGLSGYRWGVARKRKLLEREQAAP